MKTGSHDQSHINKYAKKDISQMYKDFNIIAFIKIYLFKKSIAY